MRKISKGSILISLIILCVFCIIVSLFIFKSSKSSMIENEHLKKDLQTTINTSNLIIIKDISDFEWDKLYIITPYTNLKNFASQYKLKNIDLIKTQVDVTEGINLLIFTLDKKIVSYVNYFTKFGDFEVSKDNAIQEFSPEEAIFKVENKNGQILLREQHETLQ